MQTSNVFDIDALVSDEPAHPYDSLWDRNGRAKRPRKGVYCTEVGCDGRYYKYTPASNRYHVHAEWVVKRYEFMLRACDGKPAKARRIWRTHFPNMERAMLALGLELAPEKPPKKKS